MNLTPLISLRDAWASCVDLAMLTVSHSPRYNEMWMWIRFMLAQEAVFHIVFDHDVAELSVWDSHQKQHIYCMQFTEEILNFTVRILAPTVGNIGIRPVQYSALTLSARPWVLCISDVFSSETPLIKYAPNFHPLSPSCSFQKSSFNKI